MAGFSTGRRPCRNLPNSSSTPGQTSGTGPLAGAGPWGVTVAEEAVAAAGAGPVAAAEEAVAAAGAAVVEALASCRHQRRRHQCPSKHVPTHQRRCLSALWRPTRSPRRIPPVIIGARQRRRCRARGPSNLRRHPFRQIERRRLFKTDQSATRTDRVRRGDGRCFIVCDHNRQALAYVYFEDEPGRRAAAKRLTRDEGAARVATNVAKLADLLRSPS
jgi:hypothetical protein